MSSPPRIIPLNTTAMKRDDDKTPQPQSESEGSGRENSFRSILKGTSIFGGVQVFNILIATVRLKFVSIILGPVGMGVAGLLNSAYLSLLQFTTFGLNIAVVKEIGAAKGNERRMKDIIASLRPLMLALACIGALATLFLSGMLSRVTFGNESYRSSFILLSVTVFFSTIGASMMWVLQGLHEVKRLSKASVIGAMVGLLVGVPMYWWWGTDGIVPAMTVLSLSTCIWYFISVRKSLTSDAAPWTREIHLPIIRHLLMMGLLLMSNDLFKSLVNYVIFVYVRTNGGMEEVGFYQSCNTMTSQYSAIVFTAMSMDYLPRLAGAAGSNRKMCEVVNRQMEVVGLLITPIVCAVIFLAPWVIEILQTKEFVVATPLLRLLAMAVLVRALMYPLGYIVFAKDNKRLFFWMETVGANLLTLTLVCTGYHFFGLNGLGLATIADCLICFSVYAIVNRQLYSCWFSSKSGSTAFFAVIVTCAMLVCCICLEGWTMILVASSLLTAVSILSAKKLIKLWKIN